ncbi:MAG: hypothetical protein HY654_00655 [Acidobacteria bacterium]|nr:hypothetical protein [Acidobacteriota bacterium]
MRLLSRTTAPGVALGFALAATIVGTGLPARVIVTADREASQERSTMESYDDLLVRVEERAPGFGGMFIGQDGRLAVYLFDPSQLAAARSAIEAVFGAQRVPAAGLRALQGRYTVSQLKRWTERAAGMLEMSGVTMVDLDEAKNRVAIGLEDDSRTPTVEQALVSLGIPREAVVIEVTGQIRPLDHPQPKSHSDQVRPRSASPPPR